MSKIFSIQNKHYFNTKEGEGWEKSSNQVVQYQNRNYKIIASKVTEYNFFTKLARRALAILLSFCTLGTPFIAALISKKDNLVTNKIHQLFASKKLDYCVEEDVPKIEEPAKKNEPEIETEPEPVKMAAVVQAEIKAEDAKASAPSIKIAYKKQRTKAEISASLEQMANHYRRRGESHVYNNKAQLALHLKEAFDARGQDTELKVFEHNDHERYEKRTWKSEPLASHATKIVFTKERLQYRDGVLTQDPANKYLGGGYANTGFVLEEMQVAENAEFMDLLLINQELRTRKGEPDANSGVPTPLIIEGMRRYIEIDPGLYGGGIAKEFTQEELKSRVKELDPPQTVTFLCLAAPNIQGFNIQQNDLALLDDLFNTFLASAELSVSYCKEKKIPCVIDAVKVGAGVFGNSELLVFILQMLAAKHAGADEIQLNFDDKGKEGEVRALWDQIEGQVGAQATIDDWIKAIHRTGKT